MSISVVPEHRTGVSAYRACGKHLEEVYSEKDVAIRIFLISDRVRRGHL
jgi:hypothetical protein